MAGNAQSGVNEQLSVAGPPLPSQLYVPASGVQGFAAPRGTDHAIDGIPVGSSDLMVQPAHPLNPWKVTNTAGTGVSTVTLSQAGGGAGLLTLVEGVILIAFGAASVWTAKFVFSGWDGIVTAYVSPVTSGAEKTYPLLFPWPIQGSAVNTIFSITATNNAGGNFAGTVQLDAWGRYRAV